MERQTPMERLRQAAARTIVTNTRLLEQTPSKRGTSGQAHPTDNPLSPLSALPGGVGEGLYEQLKKDMPPAKTKSERLAKTLTKGHLKGLGYVSDAMELAVAEDKERAIWGIAGGRAAGMAAAAVPPQLLTVPAATMAGTWGAQQVYDNRHKIADAVKSELYTLKDQLGRELTRYAPYDLVDRIHRR